MNDSRKTASLAFVLASGEGRTATPLNIVGEETLVKVGPDDSGGALALFHLTAPPMSGPPLHVHSREDEVFYVLDGEIVFEIDGKRQTVTAGGTVFLRRGVTHRYQNLRGATRACSLASRLQVSTISLSNCRPPRRRAAGCRRSRC